MSDDLRDAEDAYEAARTLLEDAAARLARARARQTADLILEEAAAAAEETEPAALIEPDLADLLPGSPPPSAPAPDPEPAPEPDGGDLALFDRGTYGEHADVGARPAIEHTSRPQAADRKRPPAIAFSFETDEDRDRLVALLGLRPARYAEVWRASYPPEDDAPSLLSAVEAEVA